MARRLLQTLYVVVVLSFIIFAAVRFAPGDPAVTRLGMEATREALEQERSELGLDKPIYEQYAIWLGKVVRGDMGVSLAYASDHPVAPLVWEKFKRTIPLTLAAMAIGLGVSIPLGIIAGLRPYSLLDNIISASSLFGVAAPSFWVGLMLILLFAVRLEWLPSFGYGPIGQGFHWKYFILPSLALGFQLMGALTRYMRSGMLDVMSSDYVRTAQAKGLPYRTVVARHAVKNAMLSVVTVIALDLGALLAGALVTETVFQWPGVGLLLVNAIQARDYSIVQMIVLVTSVWYISVNLLADILYGYLDPRIRYE
ncbi:MAG: ABC transporter permease [Chloroflexota bacterium]|nr:ABC transporter permease [Chloroflexota bacterium]